MTEPVSHHTADDLTGIDFADIPAALAVGQTPIETLIHLLQGGGEGTLADAGIAALDRATLDRLSAAAELESDQCLDRVRCFLDLLDASLAPAQHHLARITLTASLRYLTRLIDDHQRWRALADNATYYRDHPRVATQVAGYRHARG